MKKENLLTEEVFVLRLRRLNSQIKNLRMSLQVDYHSGLNTALLLAQSALDCACNHSSELKSEL